MLVLAPSVVRADYSPPSLTDLVLASDAIVVGDVEGLSANTFRLRVSEVVHGPIQSATIEVERFEDWTCAARWAPYAVGQHALLFLNRHEGRWQIRSAGGEGEMPIENGRVHVPGSYDGLAPSGSNAYGRLTVQGGTFVGFTLDERALAAALREARACFTAELEGRYRRVAGVRASCTDQRREAMRRTPIGAALVRAFTR